MAQVELALQVLQASSAVHQVVQMVGVLRVLLGRQTMVPQVLTTLAARVS